MRSCVRAFWLGHRFTRCCSMPTISETFHAFKAINCVSFSWIALKDLDKLLRQHCWLPGSARNDGFGNGEAHLRVVSIGTGLDVMPGMLHIMRKIVLLANHLCICIFKTSSIGIANSKFK